MGGGARRAWVAGAAAAGAAEVVRAAAGPSPELGILGFAALTLAGIGAPMLVAALGAPAVSGARPAVAAWGSLTLWTGWIAWGGTLLPPQGLAPWPLFDPTPWLALGWAAAWAPVASIRPGWAAFAAAFGVTAVAAWGWVPAGVAPPPGARTVVIVTIDALRPDRLPEGGWFDQLTRTALYLDRSVAASPVVGASTAAWMTGRGPWETGHYSDGLAIRGPTVAEAYRAAGYRTAAFVSSELVGPELGFDRGFQVYDFDGRLFPGLDRTLAGRALAASGGWTRPARRAAPFTIDAAELWLSTSPGPSFVWVHLEDPVGPYAPGDPWDKRYTGEADPRGGRDELLPLRPIAPEHRGKLDLVHDRSWVEAQYRGEVALVEHQLERLARAAPPDALWVVAGTTGEALGEGLRAYTHGIPQPAEIRVPMWVRAPGLAGRYPWPFETTDLGDLALGLAGLPRPAGARADPLPALRDGAPLRPFVRSASAPDQVWATAVSAHAAVWARPDGRPVVIGEDGTPGPVLADDDALGRAARQAAIGAPRRTRWFTPGQLDLLESLGGSPPPP